MIKLNYNHSYVIPEVFGFPTLYSGGHGKISGQIGATRKELRYNLKYKKLSKLDHYSKYQLEFFIVSRFILFKDSFQVFFFYFSCC